MATIDYKELYEQALAKAQELSFDGFLDAIAVTDIFPELAESEDERIRKDIIVLIKDWWDRVNKDNISTKEQMLAWLEKQGEKKPYGQRQECVDCQFNYAGECKGSCAMKRGEQKPAEDRYMEGYMNGMNDAIKRAEPAEWSEEDEYHKRQILRILKDNGCSQTLQERTEKWIEERLKSLKDRYAWKPSEEQVSVLEFVMEDIEKDSIRYAVLNSVLEQLKKLREE